MSFELKDVIYLIVFIVSSVVQFFVYHHKLKDLIRDKVDEVKGEVGNLLIEIERLKSKDDIQQKTIDTMENHVNGNLLPKLFALLEKKK